MTIRELLGLISSMQLDIDQEIYLETEGHDLICNFCSVWTSEEKDIIFSNAEPVESELATRSEEAT